MRRRKIYLQIHEMKAVVMINKGGWPCWMNVNLNHIIDATARNCSISVARIEGNSYLLFNLLWVQNCICREQTIASDSLKI